MRPTNPGIPNLDRQHGHKVARPPAAVNATQRLGLPEPEPRCLGPCPQYGALHTEDFALVISQLSHQKLIEDGIVRALRTMGMPKMDRHGRVLGKGDTEGEDVTGSMRGAVREWLENPQSRFKSAVRAQIQYEFWESVRRGKACLGHFRGLLWILTERITQRIATKWAKGAMREQLTLDVPGGMDRLSSGENPEEILIAKERFLAIDAANDNAAASEPTARILAYRNEVPPRSFKEIAEILGLSELACRQRHHKALKKLRAAPPGRGARC
jgi:hypothetical protein